MSNSTNETSLSLSIVIPVYNGASSIGSLADTLVSTYAERYKLEIVLVNDGSADTSRTVCQQLTQRHPGVVRFLHLSRNFGEHQAVLAGLRRSSGQAVVIMDDDFQNPPEEVGKLVEELRRGDYDVVYSRYAERGYPWFRNLASWLNDVCARYLLGKPRGLYLSSFKCLNRFLVEQACGYRGPYPYLDGLILRVTRNIGTVQCEHRSREQGESGYTLRKMISLWLNMFTNFSILPLRMSVLTGFCFAFLGLCASVAVVIEKLLIPETQIGWPSVIIAILVSAGVQLVVIGLVGEYLGRVFLTQNETPQSVVREQWGFDDEPTPVKAS